MREPDKHALDELGDSVILVHGTFDGPEPGVVKWYQPGSDFCVALDRAFEKDGLSARCWSCLRDPVDYFHWGPGENTWLARADAAQRLRWLLHREERIYHVVAHSHGGNIVLDALGWDGFTLASWFSGTVTFLGTPLLLTSKSFVSPLSILLLLGVADGRQQARGEIQSPDARSG
jgi:hypothetical protein